MHSPVERIKQRDDLLRRTVRRDLGEADDVAEADRGAVVELGIHLVASLQLVGDGARQHLVEQPVRLALLLLQFGRLLHHALRVRPYLAGHRRHARTDDERHERDAHRDNAVQREVDLRGGDDDRQVADDVGDRVLAQDGEHVQVGGHVVEEMQSLVDATVGTHVVAHGRVVVAGDQPALLHEPDLERPAVGERFPVQLLQPGVVAERLLHVDVCPDLHLAEPAGDVRRQRAAGEEARAERALDAGAVGGHQDGVERHEVQPVVAAGRQDDVARHPLQQRHRDVRVEVDRVRQQRRRE